MSIHVPKSWESLKNLSIAASVAFFISTIVAGSLIGYKEIQENKRERKLILEGIAKLNRKVILQQIISEKLHYLPIETAIAVSDRIYEQSQIKSIPLDLICGMIEVESKWDSKAVSQCGAKGLMQIMPATARPYLALNQLGYSANILFDPVVNVTVGISYLYDMHQQFVELGAEKDNEHVFTTNSYFWGQSNVASLLSRKDSRVTSPNFSYFKRVTEAAKVYKDKGL